LIESPHLREDEFLKNEFQISDITFARSTSKEATILFKYQKAKNEMVHLLARRDGYTDQDKKKSINEKIMKKEAEISEIMRDFRLKTQDNVRRYSQGVVAPSEAVNAEAPPSQRDVSGQSIIFAFIILRSMKGVDLFHRAYEKNSNRFARSCTLHCGCLCSKRRAHLKKRLVGGKWPYPTEGILPDNMYW